MRDTRKNKEYFDAYLSYQYSRIEKTSKKIENADEAKKKRIMLPLTNYEIDLIKAEYSAGYPVNKLTGTVKNALSILSTYDKFDYENMIDLLSLAVITGAKKDAEAIVKNNSKIVNDDRLLNCLASYICNGKIIWDSKLKISGTYSGLDKVFNSSDKEKELMAYLDGWYKNHKESAWYDSHRRSTDTYCGYWSFESAAAAKMLNINEKSLEKSEYYPKFNND